jgi:hypothetical protein
MNTVSGSGYRDVSQSESKYFNPDSISVFREAIQYLQQIFPAG